MAVNLTPKGDADAEPKTGKEFMKAETVVTQVQQGATTLEDETLITAENEVVPIDKAQVAPNGHDVDAEIEFALQTIIPTGEFTNIRVSVGARVRCEADTDVMTGTFEVVKNWVDEKIMGVIAEIQSD